jgi:hypothetical protein
MYFLILFCLAILPPHNSFKLINIQKTQTNYTTTSSTTIAIKSNESDIVKQANMIKSKIDDYVYAGKIIAAASLGAVFAISSFCYYLIKCYMNNCKCKVRH